MNTLEKRLEFLESKHIDKKEEPTPKASSWQLRLVRWSFQILGPLFPKYMSVKAYLIFSTPRWKARHSRTDHIIDAAKVVDFSFNNETIKLYEWGKTDAPIILLAHGWESRGTALRMYIPLLLEKGFRIVAFDSIAHGDSTGERNNLTTNAKTIEAIIKHYGGIYGAIGHSFGCSSLIFAMQYLDSSIEIEKLVFLAVPHKVKKILDDYFAFLRVPQKVQNIFYKNAQDIYGIDIENIDAAKGIPKVKVDRLLLIHDIKDSVTSVIAAEHFLEHWDNAKLIMTEGYGHYRLAKNPDVINRIVAFLEKKEDA
jgi:pimeloyl-ACP methyl ester carboxylesterase